ncbi:Uncharacterised protein [Chlamydia abortus]|uniref:Uncharacterized protein n=1 Tax=Paenibacillus residui TaxID=629724 RepID=A0ABW3DB84_9BACL|nr:Uncharacterised protein [Chlamydia abortus]
MSGVCHVEEVAVQKLAGEHNYRGEERRAFRSERVSQRSNVLHDKYQEWIPWPIHSL